MLLPRAAALIAPCLPHSSHDSQTHDALLVMAADHTVPRAGARVAPLPSHMSWELSELLHQAKKILAC